MRRGVDDDRPGPGRPERGDRATLVAGHLAGLVGVGQRQALDAEVGADLRPVEAAAAGHEHEDVVVLAAPDDDRPQQGPELDALELGALLGAVGALGPDDAVRDAGGVDRRRSLGSASVTRQSSIGRRPGLEAVAAVGECAHEVAQQAVELVALGLGQDRGDRPARDRACLPTVASQAACPASVGSMSVPRRSRRVGQPADEPGLLHPVEAVGHRAARELEVGGQSVPAERWYGGP